MTHTMAIDPAQAVLAPGHAVRRQADLPASDMAPNRDGAAAFLADLRDGVDYARMRIFRGAALSSKTGKPAASTPGQLPAAHARQPDAVHAGPRQAGPLQAAPLQTEPLQSTRFAAEPNPAEAVMLAELARSYRYALLLC